MIKNEFRVWCKDKKEWEKDEMFIAQSGYLLCRVYRSVFREVNKDTHIIEFYTGKKDKNREKIFEGDRVKTDDDEGVIRWDEKNTCFVCDMLKGLQGRYINSSSMVVVGNIHLEVK